MATTEVIVPAHSKGMARDGWNREVSTELDAGNNVKFVDSSGEDAFVNRIQLKIDGEVKYRGIDELTTDTGVDVTVHLVKGIFHEIIGIHLIYATGTDANLVAHVKL